MDLFVTCKTSDIGNKYVFIITDAFTKYAEICAIPNKVADMVCITWIYRYGCPLTIHTNRVKEFINKIAAELYEKMDIKGTDTSPSHPQCNRQPEVFNKTLAKYMINLANESISNWEWCLAPSCSATIHPITRQSTIPRYN
jgi:hypothetical protein